MTDTVGKKTRSKMMSAVRAKNTKLEMGVLDLRFQTAEEIGDARSWRTTEPEMRKLWKNSVATAGVLSLYGSARYAEPV